MRRGRWRDLLMAALALAGGATGAAAAEPNPAAPAPYQPPRLQHDGSPWTPSTYTPTNKRVKPRFLALPFLGIHSYQHQEASAYAPGLRLGTLLGGRISDVVSLNGELTLDFSNPRAAAASFQERAFRVAFNPMIEVPAGPVALMFGAKLGAFLVSNERLRVSGLPFFVRYLSPPRTIRSTSGQNRSRRDRRVFSSSMVKAGSLLRPVPLTPGHRSPAPASRAASPNVYRAPDAGRYE